MRIRSFTLFLCLCWGFASHAQTTLQVVTKNIRKSADWKPGVELIINCEKADILLEPTDSASVYIDAELSARHPNLDTAGLDAQKWQFVVNTIGKKLYVRAYIGLANGQSVPTSNMKAKLVLKVPKHCAVQLSNKFGKANIKDLDGSMALTGAFCTFHLTDLSGDVNVESEYGNIQAEHLKGPLEVQSKRSDITIDDVRGNCTVDAEYGKIVYRASAQSADVSVKGNKSAITLENISSIDHSIELTTKYGQIISAPAQFDQQSDSDKSSHATRPSQNTGKTNKIAMITSFADIIFKR